MVGDVIKMEHLPFFDVCVANLPYQVTWLSNGSASWIIILTSFARFVISLFRVLQLNTVFLTKVLQFLWIFKMKYDERTQASP